ncbi:MAG: trigger factor [Rhodospirillaceae bacterium]|jgi:trigger factor|nr:trigger factor [Rhodospirillaceae bacterium]
MQVTETNADGLKREFKVIIPAQQFQDRIESRLRDRQRSMRLPGFRPGKVPMTLVNKHFRQHVLGEELERTIGDSSAQVVSERGLRPAGQPKIEITAFNDGADLEYNMAIELLPEIEPMDFATLELTRTSVDIPDTEIDKAVERLAKEQAKSEPVTEPRPAAIDDVLVIDFVGRIDGEEFEGGKAEGHYLRLGSNTLIPGFEDQLVGATVGEKRDVNVTFPVEYPRKELANRPAVFEVTVNELRQLIPAAIDDELAKGVGLESLDALRQRVREQLQADYDGASRARLKRQLLDKLAESHEFEMPPGLVETEFQAIWRQVETDRKSGAVDPEDKDKTEEQLRDEYRAIAARRVKLGLLLSEVGRRAHVEVKQDEITRAVMNDARRYPGQERRVVEYYQNTPEALAQLRAPLYEDKVVDYILDVAKVTDRKIDPDQFAAELKDGAA